MDNSQSSTADAKGQINYGHLVVFCDESETKGYADQSEKEPGESLSLPVSPFRVMNRRIANGISLTSFMVSTPTIQPKAYIAVLLVLGSTHLLNDLLQALIPAIYPIIKDEYALDFVQIGLITLTFQIA